MNLEHLTELDRMDKLAIVLAAAAAFLFVWIAGVIIMDWVTAWRRKFLEEAELEMDEMLLMMPATRMLNYSLAVAGVVAAGCFIVFSTAGDTWNWKIGLLFAAIGFLVIVSMSRLVLRFLKRRRLDRFNEQLEEALMSMGNSLKAGFSIMQAIEMVIKQNKQPISIEFKLMMQQVHLGVTLDDALHNMALRVASEDFFLVASAISTARQTGGDLTGVFERLAVMIRERQRIQRRIRTLTAQGRLQGIVLGGLPLLLMAVLFFLDPELIRGFFTKPLGILLFIVVIILETCGFLIIRKIVNIDI